MLVKSKKQNKINKVLVNKTNSDDQHFKMKKNKAKNRKKKNVEPINEISSKNINKKDKLELQKIGEDKTSNSNKGEEKLARKLLKEEKWKYLKMREALSDPRFSHILSDPRYKSAPKDDVKIKLDSRFQSVVQVTLFF